MSVVDTVLEAHDMLDRLAVDHAFGGALALAYYAEPRGTLDVDVNVFVPFGSAGRLAGQLEPFGFRPELPPEEWLPAAGVRFRRIGDPAPLDLFHSVDHRYEEIAARKQWLPFGPSTDRRDLPFLSMEDLAMFKLSFGRDKDWVDLRRLVEAHPEIDLAYVERQLIGIRGPTMYPRLARLRALARQAVAGDDDAGRSLR